MGEYFYNKLHLTRKCHRPILGEQTFSLAYFGKIE